MKRLNKKPLPAAVLVLLFVMTAAVLLIGRLPESRTQSGEPSLRATGEVTRIPDVETDVRGKLSAMDQNGVFSSRDDVASYLKTYGRLPSNYITKSQARALGWQGGDLRPYDEDACIGGDVFGNFEGLLPEKAGRVYYECDIDTLGANSRGAKRIVFSNDGLIYYTGDHYSSFILLYGEDEHAEN